MTDETKGDAPAEDRLIARLEAIEAAILRLVEAVESGAPLGGLRSAGPRQAAARTSTGAAGAKAAASGSGAPPLIRVAPPGGNAPAGDGGRDEAPMPRYDPYSDREDLQAPPASASIEDLIIRVFEAALNDQAEETWALMSKLTHSSQLVGPRAFDHFKAFAWRKLRRTAAGYLDANNDPSSFVIDHTEPREVGPDTQQVKLFIRNLDGRMPSPLLVGRDPTAGGAWRVSMISL